MKFSATTKAIGLISLTVALAYFNSLQNEFIWDDEFLIQKNSYLHSFSNIPKMLISNSTAGFGGIDNFYRPTQNIYYLFIYQLFGHSKVAFHLGNILLHLLNGILFFLVTRKLFTNHSLALFSSLIWVAHPTHVEAITYISGTADPMGLLFFLLCLLKFPFDLKAQNWKKLIVPLGLFWLSLLSKEAMIVIPPLIMLCLALVNKTHRYQIRTYWSSLPFWISAFIYLALRKIILNFNGTYHFYKVSNIYTENILFRIYTFLATLPEYLTILFWPTDLHMERSFPVHVNLTSIPVLLGLLLLLTTLAWSLFNFIKKNNERSLWAWLWFFISFVPMMGILIPVNSFILEHWLYLPSVGFFIAFSAILLKSSKLYPRLPMLLTATITLSLCILTQMRNTDWATPIRFYNNILEYSEGSARVHNNLAMAYSDQKLWDKAIQHYSKAITLSDVYPQTHYNLARAYIQNNQLNQARKHLIRSLEINPQFTYSQKLLKELEFVLQENKTLQNRK